MEKIKELDSFVCRYYHMYGVCSEDKNCSFPHVIEKNRVPDNFCRVYLGGKCPNQKSCHFEHATIMMHGRKKILRICPRIKTDNPIELVQFNDVPCFTDRKAVQSDENVLEFAERGATEPDSIYSSTSQGSFYTSNSTLHQFLKSDLLTAERGASISVAKCSFYKNIMLQDQNYFSSGRNTLQQKENSLLDTEISVKSTRGEHIFGMSYPIEHEYYSLTSAISGATLSRPVKHPVDNAYRDTFNSGNIWQSAFFHDLPQQQDFLFPNSFIKSQQVFNETAKNQGLMTQGAINAFPGESQPRLFSPADVSREPNHLSYNYLRAVSYGHASVRNSIMKEPLSTYENISESRGNINESEDKSPFTGENFSFFTDHCVPCCTPSNRCQGDFTTRNPNPPPPSKNRAYNKNMRYHTSPFTLGQDISFRDFVIKKNKKLKYF